MKNNSKEVINGEIIDDLYRLFWLKIEESLAKIDEPHSDIFIYYVLYKSIYTEATYLSELNQLYIENFRKHLSLSPRQVYQVQLYLKEVNLPIMKEIKTEFDNVKRSRVKRNPITAGDIGSINSVPNPISAGFLLKDALSDCPF